MAGKNRQGLLIIIALVVLGAAVLYGNSYFKQYRSDMASRAATSSDFRPAFTLPDEVGLPRRVSEWDGRILILNFWATWCRPCLREIPMLIELQNDYGQHGVQIVGLSLDDREAVTTFMQRTGIKPDYPQLIGEDDTIGVAKAYGNEFGVLPFTVVIDREGHIVERFFGEVSRQELMAVVKPLQ